MPEHKTNPTAVLNSMLPELLPHGHAMLVQLVAKVVPSAGVLLYPAEHMRKVGEAFEIQEFGGETWSPAPEGVRVVHPIGQPLPPELCDVVIMLGTSVQDQMSRGIVVSGSRQEQHNTSHVMHGELMRMPLIEWQKQHAGNLRGPVA